MSRFTTWAFQVGRLGDLVVSFGWQLIAARLLTPSGFGELAVATAIATFAVIICSAGGDELVSSAKDSQLESIFRREITVRLVVVVTSVMTGAVLFAFSPLVGAAILYAASFFVANLASAYYARVLSPNPYIVGVAIQALPLCVGFLWFTPSEPWQVLSIAACAGFLRSAALLAMKRLMSRTSPLAAATPAGTVRRLSLVVSAVSAPLLGRQVHVSVAALMGLSLADIGAFSLAYSLAYLASTATILGLSSTTMPRLADTANGLGPFGAGRIWTQIISQTSALSIPTLVLSSAVAPSLIAVLYGTEYAESGGRFYVAIAMVLILQRLLGGGATNALMVVYGRSRALLTAVMVSAIVTIFANILLMPAFGMWAAVFSLFLATICNSLILLRHAHHIHGRIPPIAPQMIVILASLLGCAVALLLQFVVDFSLARVIVAAILGLVVLGIVNRFVLRRQHEE